MFNIIKLNEKDNIGIAPMPIPENTEVNYGILTKNKIPFGHKISLKNLKKGSIINIGSFSWMLGQGGMPGYTTAKSAIMGLTRSLARDLGIFNIRVNCIVPGWIITERQRKLWLTPEIEKQQLERQCIKRMLEPNDIAKPVLFFASDQSSGISAQNYVVDGGIVV